MAEIIDILQSLDAELVRRESIVDRIGKMERDIAGFDSAVRAVAAAIDSDDAAETAHRLHRLLVDRLATGREQEGLRLEETARRAALAAERVELADEKTALKRSIGAMAAHFSVSTLVEIEACIALAVRRDALEAEIATVSRDLAESLGVGDVEAIDAELAGCDRETLSAEIEALGPEVEALDDETARAFAAMSAAEMRLSELGSDGEAARLAEARRTVLMEIEEGANRYLELRLGALATDQALRLYRDRHRSSMMERASEAFRALSRGNYRGLTTQRDGQRETLIAVGADGGSKEADKMSKGTQFQLYLALRVAGYREYAATRPPVPFIADDIMESFDEERSAEALTQLSLMAGSGQVIYLTHHQHICDIARSVCPTVTLHHL